tara:strand:+ start:1401 stop:2036 length:636 start_codon:yes stop_codon:yes gene_type:complete
MHNDSYSVNIACLCSKDLFNSLNEIKSFFTFKINPIQNNTKSLNNEEYDAIIIESGFEKNILQNEINVPKVLIQHEKQKKGQDLDSFDLVFKMPINIIKFNQLIVNLCKKNEFEKNSLIKINDYILDKNQRILKKGSITLKITEREIDFIEKLNSSKQPLNKNFILKNIWSYSSETDTHTIETHIYRLRQKIKENFNDKNFIKSTKDGYSI